MTLPKLETRNGSKIPMSRSILAVAALLFLTLTLGQATAQQNQASITGNVIDAETQSPIASAVVSLRSGGEVTRSTTSDDEGTFRFSNLISGPLELHVLLVGYLTHTEELVLKSGIDLTPTVALTTDPIQLLPLEVIGRSPRVFKKLPGTVSRLESESVGLIRPIGIQALALRIRDATSFSVSRQGETHPAELQLAPHCAVVWI